MINIAVLVLLAAPPPPTPTPAPTASIKVLLRGDAQAAPSGTGSLAEVAKRIKLKLPPDQPRRLTNESVQQLSQGVQLTTAAPSGDLDLATGVAGGNAADADQSYWQQRYQEARSLAAFWEAEVLRLDGERARLETQFYAVDDPAYRDGVVKPAWDKAIEDLRMARQSLEEARSRPDAILEEARRAGALPGWFRGLPDPPPPAREGSPDGSD